MTSLYDRLGGEPVIAAAVEQLYQRILADPVVAPFFEGVSMESLKAHQRIFLVNVLGGPEPARAARIHEAHSRHAIEQRHFYAVCDHIVDALYSLGADEDTIAEVISLLAPLSKQIVNTGK